MDKKALIQYRERWTLVNKFVVEERRRQTIVERFQQLKAIQAFRKFLRPFPPREDIDEVRQRWARLKSATISSER